MTLSNETSHRFAQALDESEVISAPFRHWQIENVLPAGACDALVAWEPGERFRGGDTGGRRETRNGARVFVEPGIRAEDSRLDELAHLFESPEGRGALTALCGADLDQTALRLELCLDTDGFWLEPHTDIGAKKLTLLISLSSGPGSEEWGTDLMDGDGVSISRGTGAFNSGVLFVPGNDTWHGFHKRPITGLRRSLIVNYVDQSWRAVQELAFGPAG